MTLQSAEQAREATLNSIYSSNSELLETISTHVKEACELGDNLCFIPITKRLEPSIGCLRFNQFLFSEYGYETIAVSRRTNEFGNTTTACYPSDPE
jgi:hypothetical protein